MFEKALKAKLIEIFDIERASFDMPSESLEQEVLFIEVETARNRINDGVKTSRVEGNVKVFVNADKFPFGYFTKQIDKAKASLTADIFFFNIEDSKKIYKNIVERSFSFVYFYKDQYDPRQGTITSIEFSEV